MNVLRAFVAAVLVTGFLAAATPVSAVTECSTPDPRNAYDYCIAVEPVTKTVRVLQADPDFENPICFPVPTMGSFCPPVPDLSGSLAVLAPRSAQLTYLYANTQAHGQVMVDAVCEILPVYAAALCASIGVSEIGAYAMSSLALADITGDGLYDGIAVYTGLPACPTTMGLTCAAGQWIYLGA